MEFQFLSQTHLRLYSNTVANPDLVSITEDPLKKTRKKRTPKAAHNVPEDIRKHFSTPELQQLLTQFPDKVVRKKIQAIDHLYIADPIGAQMILKHVLKNFNRKIPFVEVNPGVGLLTELLLQQDVPDLRLFEVNADFIPSLTVSNSHLFLPSNNMYLTGPAH